MKQESWRSDDQKRPRRGDCQGSGEEKIPHGGRGRRGPVQKVWSKGWCRGGDGVGVGGGAGEAMDAEALRRAQSAGEGSKVFSSKSQLFNLSTWLTFLLH